jgi:uncharacterized protein (TIGR02147 family)
MNRRNDGISVFDYTDYRRFLADYYKIQKRANDYFSYRYFAQKAGFSSSGFYKELVDGKKSLSRGLVLKFAQAMKLNAKETDYFENMVFFNEAKNIDERKLYFNRMMASHNSKVYRLYADQYEYFSRWYYVAIRELIAIIKTKDNYHDIAKRLNPPITAEQVKKTIEVLERLRLIRKDDNGFYVQESSTISTDYPENDSRVDLVGIINFQKIMMQQAQEAYDRFPMRTIDMSTLTLSVSREGYENIKKEVAKFRRTLLNMAENDRNCDRVYQINYQLFPIVTIPEEDK